MVLIAESGEEIPLGAHEKLMSWGFVAFTFWLGVLNTKC